MTAVLAVFWTAFALVAYVYVGYPLLLAAWSRLARRPVAKGAWEPSVSLVIAARNERGRIASKLDDCRRLDYPAEKLQLVVSLDGPTDGTEDVVRTWADSADCPVVVVHSPHHGGKAAALNRGVAAASGEVLVFCDARQRVDRRAVRELVANLHDPSVGAVTGELVLLDGPEPGSVLDAEGGEASDGVGLYWRYEKGLRAMESRIHSTVGATGALYALRRELFRPIPEKTILDDVVVPMRVVLAGRRTVFEPAARAYDRVCPPELEFVRKVRTLVGNFQLVRLMPELLHPRRNPVFLQFVSHKIGRLLVPHLLVVLLVSNLLLLEGFYLFFLICQGSWYLLAGAGALLSRRGRPERARGPVGVPAPSPHGGLRR